MTFVVLYDASVLYPNTLRDLLIPIAQAGLVQAKWTDQILNLRDFPPAILRQWDIEALGADDFVLDQIDLNPKIVWGCIQQIADSWRNPPGHPADVLARLERCGLVRSVARLSTTERLIEILPDAAPVTSFSPDPVPSDTVSNRELVVLGTASQVPTRQRNHNGYVLRWDREVILFDPGEGTQRQLLMAGVAVSDLTRICVTHFHGDHCLGLPGVIQRLSLDRTPHPVTAHFPAGGAEFFARLRHASSFVETAEVRAAPVTGDGPVDDLAPAGLLSARRLDHVVETYGYRLEEPDGRRMLPDRHEAYGIRGPAVGELQRAGGLDIGGRRVTVDEVSELRPGQRFAFIMDTRECDAAYELARDADLLVIEATFLAAEAALAASYGHLTAVQAARIAQESRVRRLVLTHFSQRYDDPARFAAEAATVYRGEIVVAQDLARVPVPKRQGA